MSVLEQITPEQLKQLGMSDEDIDEIMFKAEILNENAEIVALQEEQEKKTLEEYEEKQLIMAIGLVIGTSVILLILLGIYFVFVK